MGFGRRSVVVRLSLAGILASCGSTPPSVAPSTIQTTTVPSSTSTTTVPSPTSTTTAPLPGSNDWMLVRDVDDRNIDAVVVTFEKVSLDGRVTVLFRETTQLYPTPLDVDAAGSKALMRRVRDLQAAGSDLVEYDLGTGSSRVVLAATGSPVAEYVDDRSGNLLVMDTPSAPVGSGAAATEGTLRVVSPSGVEVVVLERRPVDSNSQIAWRQIALPDGSEGVALAGQPMRVVRANGQALFTLVAADGLWCVPVRTSGAALVATCVKNGDERWRHQLWTFPLDGSAPTQLTHVDNTEVVDYGAFDLWKLSSGEVYVQRFGDCGADWVEQLQPDGSLTRVDTIGGTIIGRLGDRLVTATSGSCEGKASSIHSVDPVTGDSVALVDSQFPADPNATGIDPPGIVWVQEFSQT